MWSLSQRALLYDVGIEAGAVKSQLPAEVLRVSLATGKVLATVRMPSLTRVLLAANDDGLWFAAGQESGWATGSSKPPILYFLGTNAIRPEVIQQKGQSVNWLVASGHTAWANVLAGNSTTTGQTVTFLTPASKPLAVVGSPNTPPLIDIGEGPPDATPVLDVPGIGLIGVSPGWLGSAGRLPSQQQQIVKIDPATGRSTIIATFDLQPRAVYMANVVYGNALYVLAGANGSQRGSLYRIAL